VGLKVLRAGILSTVQDLGRWGYQRYGVPVNGVMDEYSHRLANILVGNDERAATIEITLVGPGFTLTRDAMLAVCGGDFEARVNGEALPRARPVLVRAGSTLDFAACKRGCRAYVAVGGGFDVEPVLGSCSTFVRGGFGGWHGRALKRGDLLRTRDPRPAFFPSLHQKLGAQRVSMVYPGWAATERVELQMPGPWVLRFIPGQHWPLFSQETRERFAGGEYRVGSNSDRQGYRLMGPLLLPSEPVSLLSAGVTFGTIQVPPDGEPIVLMASRQTTGGYPRLGEVISADISLLAQVPPGAAVRFRPVTLADAQALLLERERDLARMREAVRLRSLT
jgi:antagonist of KipI